MRERRLAPGPRGGPILGSLSAFRRDPIALLTDAFRAHGDVVRLRFMRTTAHLVCHPRGIRHVLQTRHLNYGKGTRGIAKLRAILGNGLLTNDGESWLRQRRTLQPGFHREKVAGFASLIRRHATELALAWEQRAAAGPCRIDAAEEMMAVTLRIVAEALFGADIAPATQRVGRALSDALHVTNARVKAPFDVPPWLPTPGNLRFARAMRVLDGEVSGMIEARRRGAARDDMLSMLIEARDPATGEGMSDGQLRDEVMSLLLAGHETTANVLTWTLYLLARHPEEQERVHAEAAPALEAELSALEQARRFEYAGMVLQESMRLYPPAWLFGRSPLEDDEIEGFHVEAGSLVFMSAFVTHRHPELWPEPERFDPERFAPANAAALDRFAYFPFGGGPRLCIGAPFASLEMPIVLASLARRLRFRLAPDAVVALEPLVTLRPRHGMPLLVERR